jgi:Protein of unknown function (DUF2840)
MSELTHVELEWIKGRIENWIRFGQTAEQRIIDSQRRVVSFTPGSVFAFIRWASNDYGTILSRIDILRAVSPGEPCSTVPHVRPGGESLCACPAGRRSRRCFTQSMASRRSASIRRTPRPIIGDMSITACPSANNQDHTAAAGIKLGCIGER